MVALTASAVKPLEDAMRLDVHRPDQFAVPCTWTFFGIGWQPGCRKRDCQVALRLSGVVGARISADSGNYGDRADLILKGRKLDIIAIAAPDCGAGQNCFPAL